MAREASKQGDGLINGADDDVILDALGLKSKGVNGAQAKNSYKYWALQGQLKRAQGALGESNPNPLNDEDSGSISSIDPDFLPKKAEPPPEPEQTKGKSGLQLLGAMGKLGKGKPSAK